MTIFSTFFNSRFILFFVAHDRPYRMAALVTLAVLIGWGASYAIQSNHHSKKLATAIAEYGGSISVLISDYLAHSVSQTDLISAQATAQNIVRKAAVSSIIIYDNNNQILAQAIGANSSKYSLTREYTSPILSGDSIIGSTTVVIRTDSFDNTTLTMWGFWWAAGLFFLSIIFFMIDFFGMHQKSSVTRHPTPKSASTKGDEKDKITATSSITTETSKKDAAVIYVVITIHNIDTLHQQLSSELRQQQVLLLDKNIAHATSLYGGEKLIIDNKKMVLIFDKKNIENAIYNIQLLLALHEKNKNSMITISGLIMESVKPKSLNISFSQFKSLADKKKPYCLYIQTDMIEKYALDSHLQYTKEADSFATPIDRLQPHYQQLIDNQLTHLLNNEK